MHLQDVDGGPESVFDRLRKRKDLKRLGYMRRQERAAKRQRKVLRPDELLAEEKDADGDTDIADEADEAAALANDIRDLEFRLNQDLDQLQAAANRTRQLTQRDISLLKLILCSGLYPQVALGDETNSYQRDQEQTFHTRNKPFVLLHPNDAFSNNPAPLRVEVDKDQKGREWSSNHQFLAYV